jgi:hypothetical protein
MSDVANLLQKLSSESSYNRCVATTFAATTEDGSGAIAESLIDFLQRSAPTEHGNLFERLAIARATTSLAHVMSQFPEISRKLGRERVIDFLMRFTTHEDQEISHHAKHAVCILKANIES